MSFELQTSRFHILLTSLRTLGFWALLFVGSASTYGKPVGTGQAGKVVQGWLEVDYRPLGTALGRKIRSVEVFGDQGGEPSYYVVYLEPCGFVIVPADDEVEPIIAFASEGTYDLSEENHLSVLVRGDLPNRIKAIRSLKAKGGGSLSDVGRERLERACGKAREKWTLLQGHAGSPVNTRAQIFSDISDGEASVVELSFVSDPRVDPLVDSRWGQTTVCGNACYNYYTPPYDPGDPDNYPCGCVGTAMAQLIRYHEYPSGYNYSIMTLDPDCGTSSSSRQAIGQLCYDAAEAADTSYSSGGSGADFGDARDGLDIDFSFENVIWAQLWAEGSLPDEVIEIINPNLDAGYPVLLGIQSDNTFDHAVVCDGYGYNSSTLYHHLNMGWEGTADAWYNLPGFSAGPGYYHAISDYIYNVFPSGSGEIISGRVTDNYGQPLAGVLVNAKTGGGQIFSDTTNTRGIYALAKLPSNTFFTVSPDKGGLVFSERQITTGSSGQSYSGNVWAVDFVGRNADFNNDCVVDACDLAILSEDWLETPRYVTIGTEPYANRLVVHYMFDETSGSTAYDSSGHGNDGQVRLISTGAPTDTAWDGGGYDANGCINFNGNVKVVVPAATFSAVNSAVTVSLRINGDAGVQPDQNWGMPFHGGNPTNDRLLHTHIPTKYGEVMFESGSYNAQRLLWEDAGSADWEGQWNHYAFTLNSAQQIVRIYHNGEKVAERTGASLGVGGIQSFHVGCGIFADETVFEYFGKIDDFRVYSYALSPDEVLSMFSGGQQSPADSAANLYFDEIIDFKDYAEFAARWLNRCD